MMELSLSVTFPSRRYHGRRGERVLEWPPSPLRLFQALIAGSHRGAYGIVNQDVRDRALKWLESLRPPTIEIGQVTEEGKEYTNYLPNNDDMLDHIRTPKPMLAKVLIGSERVIYRWEVADDEDARTNASVICAIASLVTHLGQHQDIVYAHGRVADVETPSPQVSQSRCLFEPTKRIGGKWHSPNRGALRAYQKRYRGVLSGDSPLDYPIPSHSVDYRPSRFISFDTPLALFELWQLDDARLKFEPRDFRQASAMVRHAILEHFKQQSFVNYYGKDLVCRLVAGHEPQIGPSEKVRSYDGDHFGYVPIPSLDRSFNADGYIRRVLVIGYGCTDGKARELFTDVQRLTSGALKDGGTPIGRFQPVEDPLSDSVLNFFLGSHESPSNTWRTVTPIILPGHRRRGRSEAALIVAALNRLGIKSESIDSIATFRGPIVPKTSHALDYRVKGYLSDTQRFHAEITFNKPVIGPLVVGRGRYAGFGLMMPWS
ncbi:MAG: type I-U CRISPR-associated protein Cas5/Cas6 [Nitrospira sp.]|nr:type I-U CRISPR-associated protein Cas5/Cas6 [Nitrospira sp.]